ncbi:trypsin-like serine peptidase [Blastococcus xanthinilyticus]|uniref:Serine protease n=1 Tax=Blastococcus xanthinilyticus TaxID=1564164 RepID=A0A5S5CSS7_9ACTN|nr:trypsin-like serine protease [Blastococcus xanthinilyticus]TYP86867.1 V8-like Glu-specific endopeptidase [Blastococcus xanthinilyticus]
MTLPALLPAAPPEPSLEAEVLGRDTRVLVRDTTAAPFRYICHLHNRPAGGGGWMGTGTLIGPRTILTAAHNLVGADPADIVVTPARNGPAAPFGTTRGSAALLWHAGFGPADEGGPPDVALLRLRTPIGTRSGVWSIRHSAGRLDPVGRSIDGRLPQATGVLKVNISGYPGDKCGTAARPLPCGSSQWRTYSATVRAKGLLLHYLNDTKPGHSGSPVWVRRHPSMGGRVLIAVHVARGPRNRSGAVTSNVAARLTPQLMAWIRANTR